MKKYKIQELAHSDFFFDEENNHPLSFIELVEYELDKYSSINDKLMLLDNLEIAIQKHTHYIKILRKFVVMEI